MEETWRWFGPDDTVTLEQIRQAATTGIVTALLDEEQQRQGLPPGRWTIAMRPDDGHTSGEEQSDKRVRPGYSYTGRMKGLAEVRGIIHALEAIRC